MNKNFDGFLTTMGNQLRKEYEIDDEPIGSGGLGLHWKICTYVMILVYATHLNIVHGADNLYFYNI